MVDIADTELSPDDARVLAHPAVGGVILFTRNYQTPGQLRALTASIRSLRTPHLLIATDHEGGRVQRFRPGFSQLPPPRLLGRRYDQDRRDALQLARSVGWLMAVELRAAGVDFSFAPCVDLDYGVNDSIGDRAFHRDAGAVAALATAMVSGLREGGMAAVAKHFPGHGAVVQDSHLTLPADRREFADLEADLRPYRALIDDNVPAVMAAHVVYPAVDALPASLSARWLGGFLRREMGFHGCVFADDLSMAAVHSFGDIHQRCQLALAAGCDVAPICNDRASVEWLLGKMGSAQASAPTQARLVRMRARGEVREPAQDPAWRDVASRIAALSTPPPPLTLTEGES